MAGFFKFNGCDVELFRPRKPSSGSAMARRHGQGSISHSETQVRTQISLTVCQVSFLPVRIYIEKKGTTRYRAITRSKDVYLVGIFFLFDMFPCFVIILYVTYSFEKAVAFQIEIIRLTRWKQISPNPSKLNFFKKKIRSCRKISKSNFKRKWQNNIYLVRTIKISWRHENIFYRFLWRRVSEPEEEDRALGNILSKLRNLADNGIV